MTAVPLDESLNFNQAQLFVVIEPDRRLVMVSGELDIDTVPLLQRAVDTLMEQAGDVTIDLADLTFIDSAGLNEFVRIGISQHIARHHLELVGTNPAMHRTFALG